MQVDDQQSSWVAGAQTASEPTINHATTTDTNDGFFNRPVKIAEYEWNVGEVVYEVIDPWSLFFEDTRVANRLAHFKNLQAKLHVYAVINGNPFYYGRAIMSYQPLPENDTITFTGGTFDLVQATQRPHVFLDPTKSEGGEIVCPYMFPKSNLDIPTREWRKMGNIILETFNELRHANNGTSGITISIFAYASEVNISTPTSRVMPDMQVQDDVYYVQADEYGKLSGIAHTVANFAGRLANAPMIGPYARATEMISSGIGAMASLFGYSRPVATEIMTTKLANTSMSNTNVDDTCSKLSLDVKKEVTIDPRTFGLAPYDEMALVPLAMKESWFTTFPWNPTDAPDAHLFSVRVSPILGITDTLGGPDRYHLTPAAWVSLPFDYWKGTLNFRMQVVSSAYHRGRLRVVWDPDYYESSKSSVYNVNYSTIVDISESQDMTFSIGWGQNTDYLRVQPPSEIINNYQQNLSFSSTNARCNGTLSFYVVNQLTSPSEAQIPVGVNMFTSACEDFEVCGPTNINLENMVVTYNPNPVVPPDPSPGVVENKKVAAAAVLSKQQDNIAQNQINWQSFEDPSHVEAANGVNLGSIWSYAIAVNDVHPVAFTVVNPSSGAKTVDITLDGSTVSKTLPAGIGSTLQFNYNITHPAIGYNNFPVNITVSGGAISITDLDVSMPSNGIPVLLSASQLAALDANLSVATVGGQTSAVGPDTTTINLTMPADFYVGSEPNIYFKSSSQWGTFSNPRTSEHAGNYSYPSSGPVVGNEAVISDPGSYTPWRFVATQMWYLSDILVQSDETFPTEGYVVQSDDTPEERNDDKEESNAPNSGSTDQQMGPKSDVPGLNQIYFGEYITSWRECLKRYTTSYAVLDTAFSGRGCAITIPMYPVLTDDEVNGTITLVANNDLYKYVSSAYVCARGGWRWKRTFEGVAITPGLQVKRIPFTQSPAIDLDRTTVITRFDDVGFAGGEHQLPNQRPFSEVEMPWYSHYRFYPSRSFAYNSPAQYVEMDFVRMDIKTFSNSAFYGNIYSAAAEDFTLSGFLSTPVLTEAV